MSDEEHPEKGGDKLKEKIQGEDQSEDQSEDLSEDLSEDQNPSSEVSVTRLVSGRELLRCNKLYHQGLFDEALKGYQTILEKLVDEKVQANIGYTLQALGRHQEATVAFHKYLELFIARNHAWKALCFSYYHLKDYENMTRCAREAIRWDIRLETPDDYPWQQMATAHFLMGDYSTALKAARKASTLNPKNPYAYYYEACIMNVCTEKTFEEESLFEEEPSYEAALSLLKTSLKLRPNLEEELRREGFLDEVFSLLDQEPKDS